MSETRREMEHSVPLPWSRWSTTLRLTNRGRRPAPGRGFRLMPAVYYQLVVPSLLRLESAPAIAARRVELERFTAACNEVPEFQGMVQHVFEHLIPHGAQKLDRAQSLEAQLEAYGFDPMEHEQIQADLRSGRVGLAQNRLPASSRITDASPDDLLDATRGTPARYQEIGREALAAGMVAVVSFAGGVGSRWTHGAGAVKALNPFCKLACGHRSFVEVHLAKSRRTSRVFGVALPHVITTSYLTHDAIESHLRAASNYGYQGPLFLSPGRAIGLRLVPMVRDLRFSWEEMPQQLLDEQAQKVRESLRSSLIGWARQMGEGTSYTDNLPLQCLHPVGHWYEIPNLIRNGTLVRLLEQVPRLKYLLVHNIDTTGADVDAGCSATTSSRVRRSLRK